MDRQQDEQQAGLLIPDGVVLKTMKTYLPYVVIFVQAFVIKGMYQDNRRDYQQRIYEQQELSQQWHDAFFQTAGLLQTAGPQGYEHHGKDTVHYPADHAAGRGKTSD